MVNDLVKSKITRICYEEEATGADSWFEESLEEEGTAAAAAGSEDQMRKLLKGMLLGNLKSKGAVGHRQADESGGVARNRQMAENESDVDARAFNADSDDNGFSKRIKTMKRLKGRPQMPFRIGKRSLL